MRFQLRFRMTLLSLLVSLVCLTGVLLSVSWYVRNRMTAEDLAQQILDQTAERVNEQLERTLDIASDLGELSDKVLRRGILSPTDLTTLAKFWAEKMYTHPELGDVSLTRDNDGCSIQLVRMPHGALRIEEDRIDPATGRLELLTFAPSGYPEHPLAREPLSPEADRRREAWYREARERDAAHWTEAHFNRPIAGGAGLPCITYARPVFLKGELLGVIGVGFDIHGLCRFIRDLPVGPGGFAFVVERRADGVEQVIGYPDEKCLLREGGAAGVVTVGQLRDGRVAGFMAAIPPGADLFAAPRPVPLRFARDGERFLGAGRAIRPGMPPDWLVGIVLPEADVIGPALAHGRTSFLIGLAVLLLAVLISLYVSRQVARPLEQLTQEAEAVGKLELTPRPVVRSLVKEVDRLGQATEEMKAGLRSFQKFVPTDVVRGLVTSGQEARLGGEKKTLTIFFCDVVNFTTLAEGMDAEKVVGQLGDYLAAFSDEIAATGGTVDKYIGDAVMAFWGAPAPVPEHAARACRAALRCLDRIDHLRQTWVSQGKPPLFVRVGINTGDVVVGNIGSDTRLNYTAIGDPVNLASRLEGLNKEYGTQVLVAETTVRAAGDAIVARPLDYVRVKGKMHPVLVYELLGMRDKVGPDAVRLVELSGRALDCYRRQEWDEASELFEQVLKLRPNDRQATDMLARCHDYKEWPPGNLWDGVHAFAVK